MKNFKNLKTETKIIKLIDSLVEQLWPLNRSLTGIDTLKSINILKNSCPDLIIRKTRSGKKLFDWQVPPVWNVNDAYIEDRLGNKLVNWKNNNLHLYGYSIPVNKQVSKSELFKHLSYLPDQPSSIPYVTTYYERNWGFCIKYDDLKNFTDTRYRVVIDSELNPKGYMHYGEAYLKGSSRKEILLSTYICHPSMANNELSGPIMSIILFNKLKKLQSEGKLKYSVRLLIIPETIGSINYIHSHQSRILHNTIFGLVITCVGGSKSWSLLKSKFGDSSIDILAKKLFKDKGLQYEDYSFLSRGSDERQYSGPGINLPCISIMRSKYATYPEYHTSKDDREFISSMAIYESFNFYYDLLLSFFHAKYPVSVYKCEPKLSKYKLKPTLSKSNNYLTNRDLLNVLTYCTGFLTMEEIANQVNIDLSEVTKYVKKLGKLGLVRTNDFPSASPKKY